MSEKTFDFHCEHGDYTCCLVKGEADAIFVYALDENGTWEDFMDATQNVGQIDMPEGCVCIKDDRENTGILETLIQLGVVEKLNPPMRVNNGLADIGVICKVNKQRLNELDAAEIVYGPLE